MTDNSPSQKEPRKFMAVFSAASFLNDFGSDMIYPIWPRFVLGFLGVDMAILGFIDGLGDAIVSLSQAGSGYLSDRTGKRKVFVWTGARVAAILILWALLIILHHFIITGRFFDIGDMLHHEFFEGMLLAAGLALLASSYLNEK